MRANELGVKRCSWSAVDLASCSQLRDDQSQQQETSLPRAASQPRLTAPWVLPQRFPVVRAGQEAPGSLQCWQSLCHGRWTLGMRGAGWRRTSGRVEAAAGPACVEGSSHGLPAPGRDQSSPPARPSRALLRGGETLQERRGHGEEPGSALLSCGRPGRDRLGLSGPGRAVFN